MDISIKSFLFFGLFASANCGYQEPEDALGILEYQYQARGSTIVYNDLPIYVAPSVSSPNSTKYIVWGYDIYGWKAPARTFELIDRLAAETDYMVICPDFFRGEFYTDEVSQWDTSLRFEWEDNVIPYLLSVGATVAGTVGTCWGSYFVVHASTDPIVRAGFSVHPSHVSVMEGFGENEEQIYRDINANANCAQYFGPTDSEPDSLRPNGLADNTLNQVNIVEYHDPCTHGFFNRGDLTNQQVNQCVETAFRDMKLHFQTYVN